MASTTQVLVPDIGGFKDVDVIDVLVKAGQEIDKETPMITLETEKAAMDVPSPAAGRIAQMKVKKGDKVSEGSLILLLEGGEAAPAAKSEAAPPASEPAVRQGDASTAPKPAGAAQAPGRAARDPTASDA